MANKSASAKKGSKKNDDTNVVRIKASSSAPKKGVDSAKTVAEKPKKTKVKREGLFRVPRWLSGIGGYFKGAWFELRQVRWPNRRATWSLTGAVLAYTAFFAVLVLLLDAGFKYMFELILGK